MLGLLPKSSEKKSDLGHIRPAQRWTGGWTGDTPPQGWCLLEPLDTGWPPHGPLISILTSAHCPACPSPYSTPFLGAPVQPVTRPPWAVRGDHFTQAGTQTRYAAQGVALSRTKGYVMGAQAAKPSDNRERGRTAHKHGASLGGMDKKGHPPFCWGPQVPHPGLGTWRAKEALTRHRGGIPRWVATQGPEASGRSSS